MNTKYNFFLIFLTMVFSACGNEDKNSSSNIFIDTKKNYVLKCEDGFTFINSGDIVKKEDKNTTLKVIHDTSDKIRVCVENGSAYFK